LSLLMEDISQETARRLPGYAANPDAAIKLLGRIDPDLRAPGRQSRGPARLSGRRAPCRARHPFIFLTGYGRDGIDAKWNSYPVLQKPLDLGA